MKYLGRAKVPDVSCDDLGFTKIFLIFIYLDKIILSGSENLKPSESANKPRWYVLGIMDYLYVD